jgi:hypothetical protein
LIVNLLLEKLMTSQLLLLVDDRKWWDDHLWILLDQVMSKLHEIDIQTLDLPAHWEGVQDNHQRLASDHVADFGGDELIDAIKN